MKNSNKIYHLLILILFLTLILKLIFSLFLKKEYQMEIKKFYPEIYIKENNKYNGSLKIKEIVESGIIYTNYYIDKKGEIKGNNRKIFSESQGLVMEYAIYMRDKELFDKSYNFLKNKMLLKNNLFSWEYDEKYNKKSKSSATIDDLRIFRNLVYANSLWNGYEEDIRKLEKGIRKIYKNGYLVDFTENGKTTKDVSVFYIDTIALKMLEIMEPSIYSGGLKKQKELIEEAKISEEIPLYYEKCILNRDGCLLEKSKNISMLNSLIIIYNKKLMNLNIDNEVKYLKEILERDGAIYSYYELDGSVARKIESTAIYSYLKKISELQGDKELLNKIKAKLDEIIGTKGLPISNDELNRELIYSFDLLTFLIAQNMEGKDENN